MATAPATFKTYSRKQIHNRRNSSVDVFDALLAENISKRKEAAHNKLRRRKKPIIIPDLPPPDENHHLIDESICRNWGLNDTFDRIRKEPVYNNIKPVVMTANNSSSSHSSIMFANTTPSPIIHNTRGHKKRHIHSTKTSPDNSRSKKENTLDKSVNESLLIEKEPKFINAKEMSLLSSQSILKSDGSVPLQMCSLPSCNDADASFEPMFTKTFRETVGIKMHIASTPAIASSTPCIAIPIVNETMSPILNSTQPKSLIESYEEIEKWNFKPPDFPPDKFSGDTPKVKKKKRLQPKNLQRKRESPKSKNIAEKVIPQKNCSPKVCRTKPDWKLEGQPKVILDKCLDVIGIEKSVTFGNLNESSLGFSPVQDNVLKSNLAPRMIFEKSFKKLCAQQNIDVDDYVSESPVRYITLRKRKIPVVHKTKPKTEKTDLGLKTRQQTKTSSLELNVSNKPLCSEQNNSHYNNSSSSQQELNVSPTRKCNYSHINQSCNSSESSATQNSTPSDYQELIQNSDGEMSDSNINYSCRTKPRILTQCGKNLQRLSTNSKINKHPNVTENIIHRSTNKMYTVDDNNRRHSHRLREIKSHEIISDNAESPDIIPTTPESKIRHKTNHQKSLAQSFLEISNECLKSHNYSKESSASSYNKNGNATIDVTKGTNYHDSQGTVDLSTSKSSASYENDNYCKTSENVIFINSNSRLCDESDQIEENFTKKKNLQKCVKQEQSPIGHTSILDDHNYSKVYIYDTEVIEVSSSDEEDENENIHSNSPSHVLNKSCSSVKSDCNNKVPLLQSEEITDSSNIMQTIDTSSKSPYKNTAPESQNSKIPSKTDGYISNNSDTEFDFSEFILPNENGSLKDENVNNDIKIPSIDVTIIPAKTEFKTPHSVILKPGKLWRRSLLLVRRSSIICDSIVCRANSGCICSCAKCRQNKSSACNKTSRRQSVKIVPESPQDRISRDTSVLENYASINITYGSNTIQDVVYREKNIGEPLLVRNNSIHESLPIIKPSVTARDIVLRRCGQAEPLSFTECYPSTILKNCFKIGEGVYGEVFLFRSPEGASRVMKIIPIEGTQMVNGEQQKKFEEILSEIIIAMELSNLRNDKQNTTEGFSKVEKIRCVIGRYPERLLELWELFDETRGSENDSPEMFRDNQLYIVLELANGGEDLEAFVFNNALQAFNLFKQVACALAVAESALQFEHRDLHWGNILISQTDKNKMLTYCLNDQEFTVPTCGIQMSIIDFTLSRITYDGVCIFNDLSADPELFAASGDYQFEIYKLMQKHNGNEWQHFEPFSNILWLHYVLKKMASGLRYKNINSIVHKEGIAKIKQLQNRILKYTSVRNMVINEFLS